MLQVKASHVVPFRSAAVATAGRGRSFACDLPPHLARTCVPLRALASVAQPGLRLDTVGILVLVCTPEPDQRRGGVQRALWLADDSSELLCVQWKYSEAEALPKLHVGLPAGCGGHPAPRSWQRPLAPAGVSKGSCRCYASQSAASATWKLALASPSSPQAAPTDASSSYVPPPGKPLSLRNARYVMAHRFHVPSGREGGLGSSRALQVHKCAADTLSLGGPAELCTGSQLVGSPAWPLLRLHPVAPPRGKSSGPRAAPTHARAQPEQRGGLT